MVFTAILQQIDSFQEQIAEHQQLGNELLKKIQYRFRLDWNYHSNALEGNSLTRQETRSVMINNITLEGKPLKDVLEMSGHDNVIKEVLRIGKGDARLSEKRIKEIHKAIIHDEKPENQPKIGQWKPEANFLYNYKGERYDFTEPGDVAAEIHKLLDEVNAAIDKKSVHPVLLAFQFHLKYLTIHPFYDGNGRTARILMNLLLIASGYPPVVIKVEEKEQYNRFLADIQCYGGEPDLLFDFLGKLMLRSQQLVLDAIEGKDISEPDDFEKELALIEQRIRPLEQEMIRKTPEYQSSIFANSIYPLAEQVYNKLQKIDHFFISKNVFLSIDDWHSYDIYEFLSELRSGTSELTDRISMNFQWNHFRTDEFNTFSLSYDLIIDFRLFFYELNTSNLAGNRKPLMKKNYTTQMSEQEIDLCIESAANYVLETIKKKYKSHTGEDF